MDALGEVAHPEVAFTARGALPARLVLEEVDRLVEHSPNEIHGLADPDVQKQILDWMKEDGAEFNPITEITKMSARPFLVITGDSDVAIDVPGVKHLYELAPEPKKLIIVEGADHELSDPISYETTMNHVIDWFIQHKPVE